MSNAIKRIELQNYLDFQDSILPDMIQLSQLGLCRIVHLLKENFRAKRQGKLRVS
ncbi:MAG: hypothetical protein ACJA0U_001461 [Salibacteraceae bacterium]|jgi:hypothetical protein